MIATILIAGFTLGFAGSLHCVGMCGPLSLALPTYHLSPFLKLLSLFAYQAGRIITYSLLGLIFALAGRGIYTAGIQQWFSITLGIFILLLATLYFVQGNSIHLSFLSRGYALLMNLISAIMKSRSGLPGFLLLGMANGLLPCGMVYVALAATLSFYKVYEGVAFMAMFGAGTLPTMMLIGYGGHMISPVLKNVFRKSIPFFIAATGIILIIRGLNLGIPFISPQLSQTSGQVIICHK
ncbi:MAG: sulfite exporter TauE/SafE family protein [Bacteroidota bacterium]